MCSNPKVHALLVAIAEGRVRRDDCGGERKGMWALYMLDGDEVGMQVRRLWKTGMIDKPLLGPPVINADGRKHLASAI
jgi:hypothetical protein